MTPHLALIFFLGGMVGGGTALCLRPLALQLGQRMMLALAPGRLMLGLGPGRRGHRRWWPRWPRLRRRRTDRHRHRRTPLPAAG